MNEHSVNSPADGEEPHAQTGHDNWLEDELLPIDELELRHTRLRAELAAKTPEACGLFVASRLNIYYLTGTLANGLLWLPLTGHPVLMVRKSLERARLESPLKHILPFRSYRDVPRLLADLGSPLDKSVAVEFTGFNWALGRQFSQHLPGLNMLAGDAVLMNCRSRKTPWEAEKMRAACTAQALIMNAELPRRLRPGMSERDIIIQAMRLDMEHGYMGVTRMSAFGEENLVGTATAGPNGNFPMHFNGPIGSMGAHPSQPSLGRARNIWQKGQPLCVDLVFNREGYNSDCTRSFWAGTPASVPDIVRRAHDDCLVVHEKVRAMMCPGTTPEELWNSAVEFMTKQGRMDGFMGYGPNKVPFLGHGIGLTVDEQPVAATRFTTPLEEGMFMAIEPKVGIPGIGMVGVENVIEVHQGGGICLTGDAVDLHCIA